MTTNAKDHLRIGVDLGGTKIEGLALGVDGVVLARRRIAAPREDYAATLGAINGVVTALVADVGPYAELGNGDGRHWNAGFDFAGLGIGAKRKLALAQRPNLRQGLTRGARIPCQVRE